MADSVDINKFVDEVIEAVVKHHSQLILWTHVRNSFRTAVRPVIEQHLFGKGSSLADIPGVSKQDAADFCDDCDCHYDTKPLNRYGAPDHLIDGDACCRHDVPLSTPCHRCAQLLSWIDDSDRFEREGPKPERPMLLGVSDELPSDAKNADEIVKTLDWVRDEAPSDRTQKAVERIEAHVDLNNRLSELGVQVPDGEPGPLDFSSREDIRITDECGECDDLKAKVAKLLDMYIERGREIDRREVEHQEEILKLAKVVEGLR